MLCSCAGTHNQSRFEFRRVSVDVIDVRLHRWISQTVGFQGFNEGYSLIDNGAKGAYSQVEIIELAHDYLQSSVKRGTPAEPFTHT
jgi:hypothetical protein